MTPQKTTVDWLRFRVQAEPRDLIETLRPLYGDNGDGLHFRHLGKGILGFQRAAQICLRDMVLGRVDFGGESQRGWVRVDVPGKGCEWVQDWSALDAVEALPKAEIRRLDIALTTWDGEVTHERVKQAHQQGRFITKGRPPHMREIISSDDRHGRTIYVGNRERADKFLRAYEKGKEMAAKYSAALPFQVDSIDGHRIEDIYRVEVELKAETRAIPWEVIERRDQYFTGAYPFCADVLPGVEADILQRRPERDAQLSLASALGNLRKQYGATLYTALRAYQGDMTAVWDQVVGDHHNQDLIDAGVLLVDH